MPPVIALVTVRTARTHDADLPPLAAALARRGLAARAVDWDDPGVDWHAFDLAVVRSTWDYTARPAEFHAWIARAAAATRLHNPAPVLRWNSDKHYLAELAAAGVPVVPTTILEPGDAIRQPAGEPGADLVVKPAIGAGSVDCARFAPERLDEAHAHAARLLAAGRAALVQPYLARVDAEGETALLHFDGVFSHAIRKGPMLAARRAVIGGLYLHEDITARAASAAERAVARAALAAVPAALAGSGAPLLYARVDVVPGPDGPLLLELELCEPSVFLDHADGAADRFAAAIAGRLD